MTDHLPEGNRINLPENKRALSSISNLLLAKEEQRVLEAKAVLCDNEHNLIVDLGIAKGIIPRLEGAVGIREGIVRDIAVISRVNRPVNFVVTDIKSNGYEDIVYLSRAKAQKRCIDEYIDKLIVGDVIDAKITHLESFGAFADIGCGVVALMPIDTISVSRIEHACERFFSWYGY